MREERTKYVEPQRMEDRIRGWGDISGSPVRFAWAFTMRILKAATVGFAGIGAFLLFTLWNGHFDGVTFETGQGVVVAEALLKGGVIFAITVFGLSIALDPPRLLLKGDEG